MLDSERRLCAANQYSQVPRPREYGNNVRNALMTEFRDIYL